MTDSEFLKKQRENTKAKNNELIRKMKSGEPTGSFDAQASFFPPRPIIKKDLKHLLENEEQK